MAAIVPLACNGSVLPPGCPPVGNGKAKRRRNRRRNGGGEEKENREQMERVEVKKTQEPFVERTAKTRWDQEKVTPNGTKTRARNLLVCSTTNKNIVDNDDLLLGIPIWVGGNLSSITILPEVMSYDHHRQQVRKKKMEEMEIGKKVWLRAPGGKGYTDWFPLFVNKSHFSRNKEVIVRAILSFSEMVKQFRSKEKSSSPSSSPSPLPPSGSPSSLDEELREAAVKVFPFLLNKMVELMAGKEKGKEGNVREGVILVYCQLLQFFLYLLECWEGEGRKEMERQVREFISSGEVPKGVEGEAGERKEDNKQGEEEKKKKKKGESGGRLGEMLVSLCVSKQFGDPFGHYLFLKEFFLQKAAFLEEELWKREKREQEKWEGERKERERKRRERKGKKGRGEGRREEEEEERCEGEKREGGIVDEARKLEMMRVTKKNKGLLKEMDGNLSFLLPPQRPSSSSPSSSSLIFSPPPLPSSPSPSPSPSSPPSPSHLLTKIKQTQDKFQWEITLSPQPPPPSPFPHSHSHSSYSHPPPLLPPPSSLYNLDLRIMGGWGDWVKERERERKRDGEDWEAVFAILVVGRKGRGEGEEKILGKVKCARFWKKEGRRGGGFVRLISGLDLGEVLGRGEEGVVEVKLKCLQMQSGYHSRRRREIAEEVARSEEVVELRREEMVNSQLQEYWDFEK